MMDYTLRRPVGAPREARGHRHVGGVLGERTDGRRYTAAIVAAVVAVAASAAGAYVAYEQAQQAEEIASYNKKVAEQQRAQAQMNAEAEAAQVRERERRIRSQNLAALGSQGITLEGSPLQVLMDNAREAELEARFALAGGQQMANKFESEANLFGFQRRTAQVAQRLTLLTGATNAAATGVKTYYAAKPSPTTGT